MASSMGLSKSGQGDSGWLSGLMNIVAVRAVADGCKMLFFGEQHSQSQQQQPGRADTSSKLSPLSSSSCLTLISGSPTRSCLLGRLSCPESSVHLLTDSSSSECISDIRPLDGREPMVRSILRETTAVGRRNADLWLSQHGLRPKPSVRFCDSSNVETTISACQSDCNHFFDLPSVSERRTLRRIAQAMLRKQDNRDGHKDTTDRKFPLTPHHAEARGHCRTRLIGPRLRGSGSRSVPVKASRSSRSKSCVKTLPRSSKPPEKKRRANGERTSSTTKKHTSSASAYTSPSGASAADPKYASSYRKHPYLDFSKVAYESVGNAQRPGPTTALTGKPKGRNRGFRNAMAGILSWFRRRRGSRTRRSDDQHCKTSH